MRHLELASTRDELARVNQDLEQRVVERTAELSEALNAAKRANEAKSTFLANMSHELRTPLNGILGYADMLQNRREIFVDMAPETIDDYAKAIHTSGLALNNMVSDLLDLSRIEFERFDVKPVELCAKEIAADVIAKFEADARARGQVIHLNAPGRAAPVRTDRRAAVQILTNLVSNALKYSDDGASIEIGVECRPSEVSFIVTDQGIGMSPDDISNATRPFAKFSNAHIAAGQSVGLGLSIAQKLSTLLGGCLELSSVEGKGTVARVDIPIDAGVCGGEADLAIAS